jgi:hypothetical protein
MKKNSAFRLSPVHLQALFKEVPFLPAIGRRKGCRILHYQRT